MIENKIELYHGLSHRIPNGIHKTNIPAVVSIHDLIFERFPKQYSFADRIFYRSQFKYACSNSEKVIAISEQTKKDLIDYYKVPEEKIEVCYQSCNPIFREVCSASEKENIRQLYNLPGRYFLCVGSIIERKNLLLICKAQVLLCEKLSIPLVVIGNGKVYKEKVKAFIEKENLQKQVIFLSDNVEANSNSLFKNSTHLPAIYQMAEALIYPSIFEGFGIPILEALCSDLPVIASNASCLPEAGGDAAIYFDPYNEHELADCMLKVANDTELKKQMIEKGKLHAEKFTEEKCAIAVMNVYKKILDK